MPIDRQACAGQCRSAETEYVDPPPAVSQTLAVSLEFLAVGQPIVRRQHRLCPLQMGVARQDHVAVGGASADERLLDLDQTADDFVDRVAAPKPQVGRDLVVAAAGGMEFPADVADPVNQCPLDMQVNVFQLGLELKLPLLNLLANGLQGLPNLSAFFVREQAHFG